MFIEDELRPEIKPAGWKDDIKSNLTLMWISEICDYLLTSPSSWKNSWDPQKFHTFGKEDRILEQACRPELVTNMLSMMPRARRLW